MNRFNESDSQGHGDGLSTRFPGVTDASRHADGRKPTTIADVARLAGVAKGTVSNCLNGTAPVSEGVRARVAEAGDALAYEPS